MSLSLYMHPVAPPPPQTSLGGHPVKGLLCKAFGDHDGSLHEEFYLHPEDVRTLQALRRLHPDCAVELTRIIDAVEEHGVIRLWTAE